MKEYGSVMEFLDSDKGWAVVTDFINARRIIDFPKVCPFTIQLNTDRPETIFSANGKFVNPQKTGIGLKIISMIYEKREDYRFNFSYKKDYMESLPNIKEKSGNA